MCQKPWGKYNVRITNTTSSSSSLPIPITQSSACPTHDFSHPTSKHPSFVCSLTGIYLTPFSKFHEMVISWKFFFSLFIFHFVWEVLIGEYENEIGVNYKGEVAFGALDSLNLTHWLFCFLLLFVPLGRRWQITPFLTSSIYSSKLAVVCISSCLRVILWVSLWLGYINSWVVRDEVLCLLSIC